MKKTGGLLLSWILVMFLLVAALSLLPISATELLKTDRVVYEEGEPILVTAAGTAKDWVGIYKYDDAKLEQNYIMWYYVDDEGQTSGHAYDLTATNHKNNKRSEFHSLPAGEYKILLFADDGYKVIDTVRIGIVKKGKIPKTAAAPAKVEYLRTATEPGLADGKLVITAEKDCLPDSFLACYADENGPLSDYAPFPVIACRGETTEFVFPSDVLLPEEAEKILVYSVLRGQVSETAAEVRIPADANGYTAGNKRFEMQVFSDIHLNASDSHIHNQHFVSALEQVKVLSPDTIGVFLNGDITDNGEQSQYDKYNKYVEASGVNVYAAIGNHDLHGVNAQTAIRLFGKNTVPCSGSDPYADLWIQGTHFIFLGSESQGLHADLSALQFDFLEAALEEKRDPGRPIFVFLHQGIMDTVAGTMEYQDWHGIEHSFRFQKLLKQYPEVVLFSGHSHWEMTSDSNMKPADDNLPTIFNTAACGYLWNDECMKTNEAIEGSEGYFITVYEDKLIARGRDIVSGKWLPTARYVVNFNIPESVESQPDGTEPVGTVPGFPGNTPETDTVSFRNDTVKGLVPAAVAVVFGVVAAGIVFALKKKKK